MTITCSKIHFPAQKNRAPELCQQDKTQLKVVAYWSAVFLAVIMVFYLNGISLTSGIISSIILNYATAFHRRAKTVRAYKDLKKQVLISSMQLRVKISDLTKKIEIIDRFVMERPDLKRVVEEHIEKYGEYIARGSTGINIVPRGPDDWIGQYGALSLKVIDLEHWLNQRKQFIESHTPVLECFKKHLSELKRT